MTNQKYNNQTNEEYNRERYYKRTRNHLDQVIASVQRDSNSYKYDPDVFREQYDWIKDTFYRTTGVSTQKVLMMRQREESKDDIKTNDTVSREALLNTFGEENVDRIIEQDFEKLIPVVAQQVYNPKLKRKFFYNSRKIKMANTYQPPLLERKSFTINNRPELWQEYLDRLMPRNKMCSLGDTKITQQEFFEQWIIQRVRKPYEPLEINLILRGDQGTGKNFWCDVLLKPILGKTNIYTGSTKDLSSDFKRAIYQSIIFHIEEFEDKRGKLNEILKSVTTQKDPYIGDKNVQRTQMQKYFSIAISTNALYPLTLERGDRRNFIACYSEHKESTRETKLFFNRFVNWLENFLGYQTMFDYFHSQPIKFSFNECPMTEEKEELTEEDLFLDRVKDDLILWLQRPDQHDLVFQPYKLVSKFKLPITAIQNCLRVAGYQSVNRRWNITRERIQDKPMRLWVLNARVKTKNFEGLKLYSPDYYSQETI